MNYYRPIFFINIQEICNRCNNKISDIYNISCFLFFTNGESINVLELENSPKIILDIEKIDYIMIIYPKYVEDYDHKAFMMKIDSGNIYFHHIRVEDKNNPKIFYSTNRKPHLFQLKEGMTEENITQYIYHYIIKID
jgi:hypothetical protein